jgi:hypothetical protein
MNRIWKLATSAGVGAVAAALCTVPASAATLTSTPHASTDHGVVFVQNDNLSGNTIIAYDRTASGGLTKVGDYRTGGNGGRANGAAADFLASQGSLSYDRSTHLLYAVNAGSNTLTVFAVDGDRLTRLQVISSGGDFPVSVAARGPLVFVLNGRDGGSVSGYVQVGGHLVAIPQWHRDLRLNTPTDANEFTHLPGQIGFTPDGSKLIVATKAGGNTVDVFRMGIFGLSENPAVTSLPGAVPFAFDFDANGHLVLAEAGTNSVATFWIGASGALTQLDNAPTGQAATCWIVGSNGTFYVSNAASSNLSLFSSDSAGALTDHGTAPADAGTIDAAASSDGKYLYVQSGVTGLVDIYWIGADGSLTANGSVSVPHGVGQEGIVAL